MVGVSDMQTVIDFDSMKQTASISTERVNRMVRYRLYPGTRRQGCLLSGTAGAARFLWNCLVEWSRGALKEHVKRLANGEDSKCPSFSRISFCNRYLEVKAEHEWLAGYSSEIRNSVALALATAWSNYFDESLPDAGKPKFKGKWGDDSYVFDFPNNRKNREQLERNVLSVPRIGLMRLRRKGEDRYKGYGVPKTVRIKQEGRKWYAYVCYEITVPRVRMCDLKTAVGIDMNVGQVALSNGELIHQPDVSKYEARKKRYQRKMSRQKRGSNRRLRTKGKLGKASRKIKNIRDHHHHVSSRRIADNADVVVVEDLNVKGMTRKAKGKGKRQKAGLNRGILNTGWSVLRSKLEYKAKHVEVVNPAYTSQICHACGNVESENRKTQAVFRCVVCGCEDNADVNAAKNILFLASVSGASGLPVRKSPRRARRTRKERGQSNKTPVSFCPRGSGVLEVRDHRDPSIAYSEPYLEAVTSHFF